MTAEVAEVQLARLLLGHPMRYQNAYRLHEELWRAFAPLGPGSPRPFLYRADVTTAADTGRPVLEVLVQAALPANWEVLPDLLSSAQATRRWQLDHGRRLRFLLRANPTSRVEAEGHRRRTLNSNDERRGWLERKGHQHGFVVETYSEKRMLRVQWRKGERQGLHDAVDFEGVLRVREPALLREALQRGVGPGKNWGFGLLSLAPAIES